MARHSNVPPRSGRNAKRSRSKAHRNNPPKTAGAVRPARSSLAIVLVHGIGDQADSTILSKWGERLEPVLTSMLGPRRWTPTSSSQQQVVRIAEGVECVAMRLTFSRANRGTKTIDIIEASWSRHYQRPSLLATLPWLVRIVPAILLPFLFDQRDRAVLTTDQKAELRGEDAAVLLRVFLRFLAATALVAMLVHWPSMAWLGLGVVTLALGAMAARRGRNLGGHVMMAATESPDLDHVCGRVAAVIRHAQETAERVMVVAHSQGGFLTHRIVSDRLLVQPPDTVVGVGSGLKPIHVLRQFNDRRFVVWAWAAALGCGMWAGLVIRTFDMDSSRVQSFIDDFLRTAQDPAAEVPPWSWSRLNPLQDFIFDVDMLSLPWVAACIGLVLVAGRMSHFQSDRWSIDPLVGSRWLEISSPHDPVGRLLLPRITAKESMVPAVGPPLYDHGRYFNERSLVPWIIGAEGIRLLALQPDTKVESARARCVEASRRRHTLRNIVVGAVFLIGLLRTLDETAMIGLGGVLPWIGVTILVSALVLAIAEVSAARFATDELRARFRRPPGVPFNPDPPSHTPLSLRRRLLGGAASLLCTLWVGYSWLVSAAMSEQAVAPAAFLATVTGIAVSFALLAGYRPSWKWLLPVYAFASLVAITGPAEHRYHLELLMYLAFGLGAQLMVVWAARTSIRWRRVTRLPRAP